MNISFYEDFEFRLSMGCKAFLGPTDSTNDDRGTKTILQALEMDLKMLRGRLHFSSARASSLLPEARGDMQCCN